MIIGNKQKIERLEELIKLKDKEIKDVKTECANQFKEISNLCICNSYNNQLDKLEKIKEIASDNFLALIKDLLIHEGYTNAKITKLPTTNQSNR